VGPCRGRRVGRSRGSTPLSNRARGGGGGHRKRRSRTAVAHLCEGGTRALRESWLLREDEGPLVVTLQRTYTRCRRRENSGSRQARAARTANVAGQACSMGRCRSCGDDDCSCGGGDCCCRDLQRMPLIRSDPEGRVALGRFTPTQNVPEGTRCSMRSAPRSRRDLAEMRASSH